MRGSIITLAEMLAIPALEIGDLSQISPAPLVSVIVVTYNHEAYIEQTIQGILAQQCDFPIEIIIGEDKSRTGRWRSAQDYQQRYPQIVKNNYLAGECRFQRQFPPCLGPGARQVCGLLRGGRLLDRSSQVDQASGAHGSISGYRTLWGANQGAQDAGKGAEANLFHLSA